MRRVIIASVAVLGMLLAASGTSEAGGIRVRVGRGYGYQGGYGLQGHYGPGLYRSQFDYCPTPLYRTAPVYPTWHDTTHYDWHPAGWQRHGSHFHYVPGHFDLHQDGHWDY